MPDEDRKSGFLRVRLAAAHQEEIKEAAKRAGISVSAWATERLLRAARQEKAEGPLPVEKPGGTTQRQRRKART